MRSTRTEIEIPKGVTPRLEVGNVLVVEGPAGTVRKALDNPCVNVIIQASDRKIILEGECENRKTKAVLNSFAAHVKNALSGAQSGFKYELAIVQSHFPIKLKVEGNRIRIDNFVGEKVPRYSKIVPGVTVKVEGKTVMIEGADLGNVAQTAGSLEGATRLLRRDRRRYQDGIYITKKKIVMVQTKDSKGDKEK